MTGSALPPTPLDKHKAKEAIVRTLRSFAQNATDVELHEAAEAIIVDLARVGLEIRQEEIPF